MSAPAAPRRLRAVPDKPIPPRRVLGQEVLLVLGLSLLVSSAYAIVSLLSAPIRGQKVVLYAPSPLVDQLLDIAVDLIPVLLVAHLLARSGESMRTIGFDLTEPGGDAVRGTLLAAVIGSAGIGLYLIAVDLGANRTVIPVPPLGHWWTIPVLLLGAARSAVEEEVIACGYLLHRLDQMRWSRGKALGASALLRGSYHLYQGFGGFAGNFVMGLIFGRIYQVRKRTMPLVVAHFLLDAGAGLGYLALRGKVSWLPG